MAMTLTLSLEKLDQVVSEVDEYYRRLSEVTEKYGRAISEVRKYIENNYTSVRDYLQKIHDTVIKLLKLIDKKTPHDFDLMFNSKVEFTLAYLSEGLLCKDYWSKILLVPYRTNIVTVRVDSVGNVGLLLDNGYIIQVTKTLLKLKSLEEKYGSDGRSIVSELDPDSTLSLITLILSSDAVAHILEALVNKCRIDIEHRLQKLQEMASRLEQTLQKLRNKSQE